VDVLIEGHGLRHAFGAVQAVDGVDLQVGAGEIVALLGPDGAGKTTLMRLVCGALQLQAGQIRLCGMDLRSQAEQARASLGYLPQQFSMYQELTVLENLRFFAEVRGVPTREWRPRALEILDFVGLGEFADRRAGALSGGMRQKLGLAAALVHHPQVLLMDEPTGGVDPVTRQSFWQLLIRLLEEGVGVLISTPYMDEAARAQRVMFLNRGRVLAPCAAAIATSFALSPWLPARLLGTEECRGHCLRLEDLESLQVGGSCLEAGSEAVRAVCGDDGVVHVSRSPSWVRRPSCVVPGKGLGLRRREWSCPSYRTA